MTKSCQRIDDPNKGCGAATASNVDESVPLPLVTVAHAARQAAAPAALVPRTVTLCGPPIRIPALPVLQVEGAISASDVQLGQAAVSPKRTETAEKPARTMVLPAARSNDAQAWSPQRWGRYETLCEIGRGGMGTVYLCRSVGDAGFRRLFAVKALRSDLSRDPQHSRFFLDQARIAARLHHPNVISTLDVGVRDGQPYLVMDYVEGVSLSGLLDKNRHRRSPRLLIPIILDALRGLQAAHELVDDEGTPLELVHCDVSPQNLLIGSDGVGRITDFGVARARGMQPEGTRGKPGFLSPEQLIGERVDRRSDLFSLGTVLWCALTGEQLFQGSSLEATLTNVIRRKIEPPSAVGLKPPACFDAIVLKALERDPEHRYQTAAEMLEALHAVAVQHDFLAATSAVAEWVQEGFGPELVRRQLAVIEGGTAEPVPRRGDGSEHAADQDLSSTLALPQQSQKRKLWALVIVVASLIALGMSLTFSPKISRRLWLLPGRTPGGDNAAPATTPQKPAPREVGPAFTGDPP